MLQNALILSTVISHFIGRLSCVLNDVKAIMHECQWLIVISSGGGNVWNDFEVVMNTIMNYSVVWTIKCAFNNVWVWSVFIFTEWSCVHVKDASNVQKARAIGQLEAGVLQNESKIIKTHFILQRK